MHGRHLLGIGEVAARSGLATSAIRFYEDKGLITSVRSEGGQRRFHRDVLRRLAVIQVAQRLGLTLEQIRTALADLPPDHAPSAEDWARLSTGWRPLLDARIRVLEALRDELDSCIGCGCLSLDTCRLRNPFDKAATLGPGPRWLLGDRPEDCPPTGPAGARRSSSPSARASAEGTVRPSSPARPRPAGG